MRQSIGDKKKTCNFALMKRNVTEQMSIALRESLAKHPEGLQWLSDEGLQWLSDEDMSGVEKLKEVEYHPLNPFLPEGCKVLFLGSFPPQMKRWCCPFFYPNFINDHWRIEGTIFFGDKDFFVDKEQKTFRLDLIVPFLQQKGIGFYDTATAVRRLKDNASDKFLEVVVPTDIKALLAKIPNCRVIVTTGEKATQTICQTLAIPEPPKVGHYVDIPAQEGVAEGLHLYRLPSSSRAYPLSLEKKAAYYKAMFERFL